jgi:hypothetical protein
LTQLQVIALANEIERSEESDLTKMRKERADLLMDLLRTRGELRGRSIEILSTNGVANATDHCTAPAEDQKRCQIDRDTAGCTLDWLKISRCYEEAMALLQFKGPVAEAMRAQMNTVRKIGFDYNARGPALSSAVATEAELRKNPLYQVAQAYRKIDLPLFPKVFALPQGVTVACFTSLVAALGAAVASLLGVLRSEKTRLDADQTVKAFFISPLIGALAGFMVYFVISAGTAFLVQPGSGGSTETVSNLSAPALASLGVFAGLAGETAFGWLQAKAAAFFKT